ncbi:MAG TPA: hypothetical protein PKA35_06310 [Paracoccus solventivorans]|uniref:hypothetical protein n=1 Tax=Paracoccus solventivorans TaxID=53463 RepID=UPI002B9DC401|nr:hypothetical protein [Paracoccus solventivorans]HMM08717.1 hypothetical protein [Paracoccus solventivorans]
MTIAMPNPSRTPGDDVETGLFPVAVVSGGCRVAGLPVPVMRMVHPADSCAGLAARGDPAQHFMVRAGLVRRRAPLGRRDLPALRRLDGGEP